MKKGGPSEKRFKILIILLGLMIFSLYAYFRYDVYNNIQVITIDDMALEYGSKDYNLSHYIEKVEGNLLSIKNEINPNNVGKQEIVLEVEKSHITKDIPIVISVVDTTPPIIEIKEDTFTITEGDSFNFIDNIVSIRDEIDGEIPYVDYKSEENDSYYFFDYDIDTFTDVGEHEIQVVARDQFQNESRSSFTFKVEARKIVYYSPVYRNLPANPSGGDLVSIALSYLGYPYIGGSAGAGPYGFDCSGFVQYVYKQKGIYISRGTGSQLYDGYGIAYEEAQPGDIILWGYGSTVTHSSMYIGNGQMIHSANYSTGVIISDVGWWLSGSGTHIVSVRRVQ